MITTGHSCNKSLFLSYTYDFEDPTISLTTFKGIFKVDLQ